MTIAWFIWVTIDMFRPLDKQIQGGEESTGCAIAIFPCMLIDCIILSILYGFKIIK